MGKTSRFALFLILFLLGYCANAQAQALPKAQITFTTVTTDDKWITTAYRPAKIKIVGKDAKNSSEGIFEIHRNVTSGENTIDLTPEISSLPPGEYDVYLKLYNSKGSGPYAGPVRFKTPLADSQALQPTIDPGKPLRAQDLQAKVILPPPPTVATISLFGPGDIPAILESTDVTAYTLGVRFRSSVAGKLRAIKFYKGPQNRGPHSVQLWSATGTLITESILSEGTSTGWQSVTLPTPQDLLANTDYVASYHCPAGRYSVTVSAFNQAKQSGVLTAPASATGALNGVFKAGAAASFPNGSFQASNYWIDVSFEVSTASTPPPKTHFLAWESPTLNSDGTPLTDLAGYRVEWGTQVGSFSNFELLGIVNEWPLVLLPGQYWLLVKARDRNGNLSSPSSTYEFLVQ